MFVIVPGQIILCVAMLVRLPGMIGLTVLVVMGAALDMAVGMTVLMEVLVGMIVAVGVAVPDVAMGMLVGMDVTVLVGVVVLVFVPFGVVMMMAAMHGRPPGSVRPEHQCSAKRHLR